MTLEQYKQYAKENEDWTPGWEAIDRAFESIYHEQKPKHYATNLISRASLGGDQYLDGYSIYKSEHGYSHIVTYGMSELYVNEESFGGEWSGWGYEMTFKLMSKNPQDCLWVFNIFANLAFLTNTKENFLQNLQFIAGDNKPIDRVSNSQITGLIIVYDTEILSSNTPHGRLDFLQLVGITQKELEHIARFEDEEASKAEIQKLVHRMQEDNPYLVTNMQRDKNYI